MKITTIFQLSIKVTGSDEEKDDWLKKCTPVKEDSAHSITAICTDAYGYNKSWFLPCRLHKWITENNITAT